MTIKRKIRKKRRIKKIKIKLFNKNKKQTLNICNTIPNKFMNKYSILLKIDTILNSNNNYYKIQNLYKVIMKK